MTGFVKCCGAKRKCRCGLLNESIQLDAVAIDHHHVTVTWRCWRCWCSAGTPSTAHRRNEFGVVLVGTYTSISSQRQSDLSRRSVTHRDAPELRRRSDMPGALTPRIFRGRADRGYGRADLRSPTCASGSLLCLPEAIWAWPVAKPEEIDQASLPGVRRGCSIDTLIIGTGTRSGCAIGAA